MEDKKLIIPILTRPAALDEIVVLIGESPAHRDLFEKGVKLSALSRKQLEQAEAKVEILLKKERKGKSRPCLLNSTMVSPTRDRVHPIRRAVFQPRVDKRR